MNANRQRRILAHATQLVRTSLATASFRNAEEDGVVFRFCCANREGRNNRLAMVLFLPVWQQSFGV
jgi:hypothetical protein